MQLEKIIAKLLVESWINLFVTPLLKQKKWRPTLVCQIVSVYLKLNQIKNLLVKMKNYQIITRRLINTLKIKERLFHLS
ncbi:Uncharacterised protein [Mycobacteroides abscessus subsp. abscessus]|nr:Uncharacterised protein [Mycobacteroides abscessus subsp. abscessus]